METKLKPINWMQDMRLNWKKLKIGETALTNQHKLIRLTNNY